MINKISAHQDCHLFAGEHAYCLPGMDGYVGRYEEVEHAMRVAEGNGYDWAHIVELSPHGLQIVQVGRWNAGLKCMIWQADFSPVKQRDRYIKTFCSVMKAGVLLIGKFSATRKWGSPARMALISNALSLYDDIQFELGSMPTDEQNASMYLARQVIAQMIESMRRVQMSHKERGEWLKWCSNAQALIDSTKDLNLFTDQWTEGL